MKSKKFFKKTLTIQIIFLLVLIVVFYFFKLTINLPGQNTSGLATLVINFETEKRFFEGEVFEGMTVLDALSAAVLVGQIKFNYAIDKFNNVNIMEIDGQTNGINNKHFVFYLNSNKIAVKDLNKKEIHRGDRIEIRNE